MIKIYIASPYTIGDQQENVDRQRHCANELIDIGFLPIWPLSSHYLHELQPRHYEIWMTIDLNLLRMCDIVLRLDGQSPGADREVFYAQTIGIPVVYSVQELQEFFDD